jgi:hypothetical protein
MGASNFEDLKRHIGHRIVCVGYGMKGGELINVSVECNDCSEVLLTFDKVAIKTKRQKPKLKVVK